LDQGTAASGGVAYGMQMAVNGGSRLLIFVRSEVSDRPVTSLRRVVVWLTGRPVVVLSRGRTVVALALSACQ
jgi:hypothetical protein